MYKVIIYILSTIITSFYFFSFEFSFLPGANTKMIMAGMGLVVLGIRLAKGQRMSIDKDVFILSIYAIMISLASLATMIYNNTSDTSFLTYFISMWVWLGGAYFVVMWLKQTHGYLSIRLVSHYLICVCVAQCVIALTMDMYSPLKQFVDSFLGGEEAFMGKAEGRLYGIGAALDVAGFRFASVLIIISVLSTRTKEMWLQFLYVLAFIVILIIGSMIGRSTVIGAGVAFVFLVGYSLLNKDQDGRASIGQFWKLFLIALVVGLPFVIYEYNTNPSIRENIRFGFEGFFSMYEKGYWSTNSTDILVNHMIVFPETMKTWIIGDGYCANPYADPYYTGRIFHGFYMGTDIGFIRFLFYFGIIGTLAMVLYMCNVSLVCARRFPNYRVLFVLLLLLTMIEWLKVSTDIFLVFAPFLCISSEEEQQAEQMQHERLSVKANT